MTTTQALPPHRRDYIPVSRIMSPAPIAVDGLATVSHAVDLMRSRNVSSLVIRRRYEGDEWGILVVGDIARAVINDDRSPDRTNVYEIMSKPVLTVEADMDVKYAIRMLVRFGLSRALVLDKGELVGIVTLRDMTFRYLSSGGHASAAASSESYDESES